MCEAEDSIADEKVFVSLGGAIINCICVHHLFKNVEGDVHQFRFKKNGKKFSFSAAVFHNQDSYVNQTQLMSPELFFSS